MRTRTTHRAFTLIEILIVVVILGILAAIVIPQFTDASEDAGVSSVRSQLQTIRSQIELYRVQHAGNLPASIATETWDDLVDEDYLQQAPRNPLVMDTTATPEEPSTLIAAGTAAIGAAAGDDIGWYWNTDTEDMFGVDQNGNIMDW